VGSYNPDEIDVQFDDGRLVADAGLILPATLAVGLADDADDFVAPVEQALEGRNRKVRRSEERQAKRGAGRRGRQDYRP